MVFNPIFVSRAGAEDLQESGKQSKIASANYMFSDIIKVYLNDAPETASGLTPTTAVNQTVAVSGEVVETATLTGEENETDAANALILSGESLQTAKLPAMQLVEFANAFLPVEAAKLGTLESVSSTSAASTTSSVIKSDVQESISIQNYFPSEFNSTASVNTASVNLMTMANPTGKTEADTANAAVVNIAQSGVAPTKSSLEEKALQDLHAAFNELMQTAASEGKQTKSTLTETVAAPVAQKLTGTVNGTVTSSESVRVANVLNNETVPTSQVKIDGSPIVETKINTNATPMGVSGKQAVLTEPVAKELGLNQVKYTAASTIAATASKPAVTANHISEMPVSSNVIVDKTVSSESSANTAPVKTKSDSVPTVNTVAESVPVNNTAKEITTSTSTSEQTTRVKNSGTVVVEQNSTVVSAKPNVEESVTTTLPTEAKAVTTASANTVPSDVKLNTSKARSEVKNATNNTVAVKTAEVNRSSEKQETDKPEAKTSTMPSEKVIESKSSKPVDVKQAVHEALNAEQPKTDVPAEATKTVAKEIYRSQPHVVKSDTPIKGIKLQAQNATNTKSEVTVQTDVAEETTNTKQVVTLPNSVAEKTASVDKSVITATVVPEASEKSAAVPLDSKTLASKVTKTELQKPEQTEKVVAKPVSVNTEEIPFTEQKAEAEHIVTPKATVVSTESKVGNNPATPIVDAKQPSVSQPAKLHKSEIAQTPVVVDNIVAAAEKTVSTVSPKSIESFTNELVIPKAEVQKDVPAADPQKTVATNKEAVKPDVLVNEESKVSVSPKAKTAEATELKNAIVTENEVETASAGGEPVKQAATVIAPKIETEKTEKVKIEAEVKPLAAEQTEKAAAPVKKETSDFADQQKDEKQTATTVAANSKPEKEQKHFVVEQTVTEKNDAADREPVAVKTGAEYQRIVAESTKTVPAEESAKVTETESSTSVKEVVTQADNRARESVHNVTTKPVSEFEATPAAPKLVKVSDAMKEVQTIIEAKQKETMVFQLDPENMGKMKVTLTNVENILRAHIEVETESARKTLESNMQQLLQKLESNGVQVQSVQITMQHQDQQKRQPHYNNKKQQQSYPEEQNTADHEDSVRELGYNTVEYVV